MSIQFKCPGCGQPIEVDDLYAGQAAQCPYCDAVITVPMQSTLRPSETVTARPAQLGREGREPPVAAGPGYDEYGRRVLSPREKTAARFGNFGLVTTAIVIALMVLMFVRMGQILVATGVLDEGHQPTPEELEPVREEAMRDQWIAASGWGMLFFAVLGIAMGSASLAASRRANWRAYVTLAVCGGFLGCVCLGTVGQVI